MSVGAFLPANEQAAGEPVLVVAEEPEGDTGAYAHEAMDEARQRVREQSLRVRVGAGGNGLVCPAVS